jgi:uncharacterized membrane protein YbhN (UPF0104 family)
LALILSQTDFAAARRYLDRSDWRFLGVALVLSWCLLVSRTVRFRVLFPSSDFAHLCAVTALQNFFVRVMPFRLGELSYPILIQKHVGESPAKAIVHLLLVRIIELWLFVCAGLLALLSILGPALGQGGVGLALGLGVVTALLLTFGSWVRLIVRLVAWTVDRLPKHRFSLRLSKFLESLSAVASRSERLSSTQRLALWASSVAVVALQYMMVTAVARGFGVHLGLWQAIVGISIAQAASALPVATIGSFGSYEAGWTAGFVLVGLPVDAAVVSAIASQLMTLLFAGLLAVPSVFFLRQNPLPPKTAALVNR